MRLVHEAAQLPAALASARSEALAGFGNGDLLIERAVLHPRHVEVQVFADTQGHCIHLGERDCSVQRRHQKIIEESPSPAVDAALRDAVAKLSRRAWRVSWLTPLATTSRFQPQTEALIAIRRFVDDLVAGGSSAAVVSHLLSLGSRRAA